MTREDYIKVASECVEKYDESWNDMDVLQPLDDSDCYDSFISWLLVKKFDGFERLVDECKEVYGTESLWDVLHALSDSFDYDVDDCIELLADYAVFNTDFGKASYEQGLEYLSYRSSEDDEDELNEDSDSAVSDEERIKDVESFMKWLSNKYSDIYLRIRDSVTKSMGLFDVIGLIKEFNLSMWTEFYEDVLKDEDKED